MIENKFLHYQTQSSFEKDLSDGLISDESVVFIKDTNALWTHGKYWYTSPEGGGGVIRSELITEDLNDIRTLNLKVYYGNQSNKCLNKPSGVTEFNLISYSTSDNTYCHLLTGTGGILYKRVCNNGVWTEWLEVATINSTVASSNRLNYIQVPAKQIFNPDDLLNSTSYCGTVYTSRGSELWEGMPSTVGIYNAKSILTLPINGPYKIQLLFNTGASNIIYYRVGNAGSSPSWKELATRNSTVNQADQITTNQLTNEDLNNIIDSSFKNYWGNASNSCLNKPAGVLSFNLMSFFVSTRRAQILISHEGKIFTRYYDGSVWEPWKTLMTDDMGLKPILLASGTDLNDILGDGNLNFYYTAEDIINISNKPGPENSLFGMFVYRTGENYRQQILTVSNTGDIYTRRYLPYTTPPMWDKWKRIVTEDI